MDHISIAKGISSGVNYVMADMTTKERTFFCSPGANAVSGLRSAKEIEELEKSFERKVLL